MLRSWYGSQRRAKCCRKCSDGTGCKMQMIDEVMRIAHPSRSIDKRNLLFCCHLAKSFKIFFPGRPCIESLPVKGRCWHDQNDNTQAVIMRLLKDRAVGRIESLLATQKLLNLFVKLCDAPCFERVEVRRAPHAVGRHGRHSNLCHPSAQHLHIAPGRTSVGYKRQRSHQFHCQPLTWIEAINSLNLAHRKNGVNCNHAVTHKIVNPRRNIAGQL